ncbi:MAG: multidrug transporter [Armatimonadetes bacterium]|nr:multidrug transporter [Armatimonadota bacterium]
MAKKKHRSAVTGEYVTKKFAKKHPRTTVAETPHKHGRKKGGKKK